MSGAAEAVLLDVANTLLWKPGLVPALVEVLRFEGLDVLDEDLLLRHRILVEATDFPDHTDRAFYDRFNSHLLRGYGLVPSDDVLDRIYDRCHGLPWVLSPGAERLASLEVPVGVVSNWRAGLEAWLAPRVPFPLDTVVCSAEVGVRKPSPELFESAVTALGVPASSVLYVGDSPRLDMEPAAEVGLRPVLFDPHGHFPGYQGCAIRRLDAVLELARGGTP